MARLVRMCPSCKSVRMKKYDIYHYGGVSRIRYKCEECGKLTIYPLMRMVAERKKKKPNSPLVYTPIRPESLF